MMYSEFLYIADVAETAVSAHEYSVYIEPLYMADETCEDKFQWCARYAKGLIAALPAIRFLENANAELTERVSDMDSAREEDWKAYQNVLRGREEARKKVGELTDILQKVRECVR